ncbi:histidinol-phosphatase HisJ [Alkalihalobacillus sp. MEB130]|uniref:histidinol-phosphatase HisJ n=1 Tax=Alkalihalobacillus sp. MEB130 TaxID=2976704 RepID=UPI0028E094EF|nr:histidinol-phosphatase HisJ [Alkalihalobacillus sp. MEB130]MDT8859378.1 histidinol-phosphatase HisJ [Alkalihalobacillus sp. MEB130]
MIHDGHVHSPYCPHGTSDSFEEYCDKAIEYGYQGITFTEHAPLPSSFKDPTPMMDSAMKIEDVHRYLEEIEALKQQYKGHLNVYTGLEVDYIEGYEHETTAFLNEIGPLLDDSILSVHFLHLKGSYLCIDYSPDVFQKAALQLGSIDAVYQHYYKTVASSIRSDLGPYKPKRIGHITLARKFAKKYPAKHDHLHDLSTILHEIKNRGYELDYNGAGCIKPLCKEPYPYDSIIERAMDLSIPLVYGSDAHQVTGLLSGSNQLVAKAVLSKPQQL